MDEKRTIKITPVYEDDSFRKIIGEVPCNSKLDCSIEDDQYYSYLGLHKGIEKFKGGYVIILSFEYPESQSRAFPITDDLAVLEIVKSGNLDLFQEFTDLCRIWKKLREKNVT
jgi:hypothetical protein